MAQLARERRVHHRRIYARPAAALHRELYRLPNVSDVADDCWNSVVDPDRGLHGVSLCTGEGARHVAEPAVAAAFVFPGAVAWLGDPVAAGRNYAERVANRRAD